MVGEEAGVRRIVDLRELTVQPLRHQICTEGVEQRLRELALRGEGMAEKALVEL